MKKPVKHFLPAIALASLIALAASPSAQAGPDGATLFRQRCASCHVAPPNASFRMAPDLAGVVGRKAGTAPGFNYSPALKASKLTWTRANLDRFLQAPMRMVPGTRMVTSVPDSAQRTAILAYLSRSGG